MDEKTDVYKLRAALELNIDYKDVTPEQRAIFKAMAHTSFYEPMAMEQRLLRRLERDHCGTRPL
jgi:hypothetical protein